MTNPRILIMHAPGTNRDREAAMACTAAGGMPEIIHMNRLVSGQVKLDAYQMIVIPGGFSFGDDLGAGRLWANDLTLHLRQELDAFVASGKPVMGICNGFQVLVKAGYLPGPAPLQTASLTYNRVGHFECRWVRLRALPQSPSVFTQGLDQDILCPVAHGEGRLALREPGQAASLIESGLVPLRYVAVLNPGDEDNASADTPVEPVATYPHNPNGSPADIAALCNAAGNVLGLMPHPEDHIHPFQHPRWSRGATGGLGLVLFANGVRAARAFV